MTDDAKLIEPLLAQVERLKRNSETHQRQFSAANTRAKNMTFKVHKLKAENERLREALQWYANPANWCDSPDWDGPDTSTPKAVPIRIEEEMGPMICDCGDTARAALSGDHQPRS